MAQRVVTVFTDDLTGEVATKIDTYRILINGAGVELHLTPESRDKLMAALHPFLRAEGARRVLDGSSRRGVRAARVRAVRSAKIGDSVTVRAWARDNGYEVNDRGRVPAAVRVAYENAH